MLDLSCRITNELDLRTFATKGLRVAEYTIDGHISTEESIQLAAQKIIKVWRRAQGNSRVAHSRLCDILRAVEMNFFIPAVLSA